MMNKLLLSGISTVLLPLICAFLEKHKESNQSYICVNHPPSQMKKASEFEELGDDGHCIKPKVMLLVGATNRKSRSCIQELIIPLATNLSLRSYL